MIDKERKLKILGCCLNEYRKKIGYSAEYAAQKIPISKAYLCEIEKGKKSANEEILNLLFKTYQIQFHHDEKYYHQAQQFFYDLVESDVLLNHERSMLIYREYMLNREDYLNSYGLIYDVLIQFFFQCRIEKKVEKLENFYRSFKKMETLFDNKTRLIFYDTYCGILLSQRKTDEAFEIMFHVIDEVSLKNAPVSLKGMIYFHQAAIFQIKKDYLNAIAYIKQARKEFNQIYCIERSENCLFLLGNIYLDLRFYQEADEVYLKIIENAQDREYQLDDLTVKAFNNLAWSKLLQKDYENARFYTNQALNLNTPHSAVHFYAVYLSFHLDDQETFEKTVKTMKQLKHNEYTKEMICLIEWMKKGNDKKVDRYAGKVIEADKQSNEQDRLEFTYTMMIDYYKDRDQNKTIDFLFQLNNVLKNTNKSIKLADKQNID